jgi:hypothetical protein
MRASLRRRPCSPAAGPLEDEDLLSEILLRLPPLPSSLPRASAVSTRWRSLVSDPRFSRRFRAHHRRNPPLLGFFVADYRTSFLPILEAPNRVPQARFSLPIHVGGYHPLCCRHGLMLVVNLSQKYLLVWDPVTGDQHRLDMPPGFDMETPFSGAVLRAAGEAHHFQVALIISCGMHDTQAVASVYSSEAGEWGNLITSEDFSGYVPEGLCVGISSVTVGDCLYWLFTGTSSFGILELDLDRQSLRLIPMPGTETLAGARGFADISVLTEGGVLGFLFVSGYSAQIWKRRTDGADSWVLGRTIALDRLLPMNNSENKGHDPFIYAFAEENKVVLLQTSSGMFTIQLESLQFKKLPQSNFTGFYPFEGVYTAGTTKSTYPIFWYYYCMSSWRMI